MGSGVAASPGAATGKIVFSAEAAQSHASRGIDCILVRRETSPEDVRGMHAAVGVVTERGGITSHAAVIGRGIGLPCVVGVKDIRFQIKRKSLICNNGRQLKEGDEITIDGTSGDILFGSPKMVEAALDDAFQTLLEWTDEVSDMTVRANADTPQDALTARKFNAQGIGLCRTEHMFFEGERIIPMREMIMSESQQGRKRALKKLIDFQIADFESLFLLLKEKPITVRLLDPPMHEFLPKSDIEMTELGNAIGVSPSYIREMLVKLSESNPMLGHRGVRLGLSYPEIYEMQVEAILRAAYNIQKKDGVLVTPEIMIPLVMNAKELHQMKNLLIKKISKVQKKLDYTFDYTIGTMIELPSAALNSGSIAEHADFFSFGTNDLTQTTFGISRDDSGKFLNDYIDNKIFSIDPFISMSIGKFSKVLVPE